jgi:pimeloyl-ACP methyl ester carboxylesterase
MIFHEYGEKMAPAVMLLHGGGLSYWMWKAQIEAFKSNYRVIVAVIDGHGEASGTPFVSIRKSAAEAIEYIGASTDGKLFSLCGLSLGAQIAIEILSRKSEIAQKAIIESALVIPQKWINKGVSASVKMSYPLIKRRWFAKLQAAQLKIPDNMFEDYFRGSAAMGRDSLIRMLTENSSYKLPENFRKMQAQILVLCGGRERPCMKESARLIASATTNAFFRELPGFAHGEMTLNHPEQYIETVLKFFGRPITGN